MSKIKPNIVRGGQSIDLGNNMFLMQGRPHSRGGIDIGKNLEVEGGEVMEYKPNEVRVFSKEPILNGISPAQYVLGGANPNDVFNAQEYWKRANRVSDDGKIYRTGGKIDKRSWTTILNKRDEGEFLEWYKNLSSMLNLDSNPDNPFHAYDYRGYWLENRNKNIDYTQPDFHFTDKYKKPTHPTFSRESQYAKKKYGINPKGVGYWKGDEFIPGVFNDLMGATSGKVKDIQKAQEYTPSENIVNYIKSTEGFRDKWYKDGNGIWTVGYGFTGSKVRKMFPNGMTRQQADKYLADSLNIRKQILQRDTPNWDSLNQNQRDALLSYHYNIGESNYRNKSPKMQQALRDKNWDVVSKNIDAGYNDKNNPGLRKRRDYERNLFNTPITEKKLGGRINKPANMDFNYIIGKNNIYKLGGRQKAPLGIDILNSQNLHRNAEVFDGVPAIAVSEQVVRPNLAEQQRLLDEASQIINNSIETNIDNSIRASISRGDSASNRIRRIRNINVPLTIDGRSATINKDGTIDLKNRYTLAGDNRGIGYKSISERNKLLRQAKVRNAVNNIKQGIKDNSSELLSTGINLAGNLAGSLINLNAINKMKYYDIIPLRANKLKTNVNINPQLDTLREQLARFEGDTRNNTSSSKVALARRQGARARTAQAINQLFGTKENLQTELINRDRLNQQQVGNMNVQMRNRWRAGKSQFDNQIRNMRAENAIAGINNAIAAFNGENGYFNTRDKKFNEQANRALYALTAPNAVDAITSKNAEKLINTFVEPRFRKRMRRSLGID